MEVFCLASGPSLALEDVERVQAWRGEGRKVFVVNNTWQLAPWADLLFVGDGNWLEHYGPACTFAGERITASSRGRPLGWTQTPQGFNWYTNSGAGAIAWAMHKGARRVYLLGYDCQRQGVRAHWHEPHNAVLKSGRKLRDAPNMKDWHTSFANAASHAQARGVEVINCTRSTALRCFQRATLESVVEPAAVAA